MKNYLILSMMAALVVIGCAAVSPDLDETIKTGQMHSNTIQIKDKTIPLPEGKWKVVGSAYAGGKSSIGEHKDKRFYEIILIKETNSKAIGGAILISTNTRQNSYRGYKANKYCGRKDLHHVVVNNNRTRAAQDCWLINHNAFTIQPSRPALEQTYNYVVENKYTVPKVAIEAYHHFTGKYVNNRYLDVRYYYNPEAEGFDPPIESDWSRTEWNPLQINAYPKKVEYIKQLENENALLHEKLREGFRR